MTSLSYLNLSYNNLSGTIPSGHQLDTLKTDDPASMYIGNPGLCGHPLPKACPGDNPTQEDLARWHEADSTHTDFHLGFTVGFLAGLWIIFCGLFVQGDLEICLFQPIRQTIRQGARLLVTWQQWLRKPGTN